MTNNLRIFKNEEFGEVRTVIRDDTVWFVGKDVAEALGYKNTKDAIINHVDKEDKRMILRSEIATLESHLPKEVFPVNFVSSDIPNRGLITVNESGLYSLILSSKLPNAKRFKHWVTSEVLPSIHKNGGYIVGQETDSPEVLIAKALVVAQNIIEENQKRIAELTPKAEYFDALVDKNLLTSIRDTAKELGIKERKFIKWLEEKGYIYRDGRNKIRPYATYTDGEKKYFEIKDWKSDFATGVQTLITPRGKETFRLLCHIDK